MKKALLLCLTFAFSDSALSATNDEILKMVEQGQVITHDQQQQVDEFLRGLLARLKAVNDKAQTDYANAQEKFDEPAMMDAAKRIGESSGLSLKITDTRYKVLAATHVIKKQASEVDDLFGGMADGKKAQPAAKSAPVTKPHTSNVDLNGYSSRFSSAIQSKMVFDESFKGKECDLSIKLQRDGTITDVKSEGGDIALCSAAIDAVKKARIPAPPNDEVWDAFKNTSMTFKP